jgi:anti-sigma regulatory factor (Ser/Thr protein kinase)
MLCVVRATVGEMAATSGFSPGDVRLIVLSVDEAMTNVIRHAYSSEGNRPIHLLLRRGRVKSGGALRDALEIRLADRGAPVEAEKLQGRDLEDIRPGGLGLHFIRETMDSVTFRHIGGRNYLRLVKLLPTTTPGETAGEITCK